MSIKWGADLFGMELLLENLQSVPLDAVGAGVCAVAVGVFIASAKLALPARAAVRRGDLAYRGHPHLRRWSTRGSPAVENPYGFYASAGLLIAAHLMLFVGSFLLLSHLLPLREADIKH